MPLYQPAATGSGITSITVQEADGNPTGTATTLVVSNATLTSVTGGTATLDTSGGAAFVPAFGGTAITAADFTGSSTAFAAVTGGSVTVTTGANRALVTVVANGGNNLIGDFVMLDMAVDGTRIGGTNGLVIQRADANSNNYWVGFSVVTDVLTAAAHDFALQYRVTGGTATVHASTASPLRIAVQELNIAS